MSSPPAGPQQWLTRRGWLGLALFAAATAAFALAGRQSLLPGWALAFGIAGLLLGLAVMFRRGWLSFFGPVLFYDLIRTSRRTPQIAYRSLYVLVLLFVLGVVYLHWAAVRYEGLWETLTAPGRIDPRKMPRFAASFFAGFMVVQTVLVLLLTPAYTAGAIAEEKERKTLEFLLATELTDREIVLAKFVSRLGNLGLLLLAGLPVLSGMQFLGGVDPNLLLASTAGTALTMSGLGALSILLSVCAERPRDAIFRTYLVVGGYLVLSGACCTPYVSTGGSSSSPILHSLLLLTAAGNPVTAVTRVEQGAASGPLEDVLPAVLRDYALFHGTLTVVCLMAATALLRRKALGEEPPPRPYIVAAAARRLAAQGRPDELLRLHVRSATPRRPRVSDAPMLWKEVHIETGPRLRGAAQALLWSLLVGLVGLAALGFLMVVVFGVATGHLSEASNGWVRVVATPVACLTFLGIAVRAAGSLTSERERRTLDGLLTSGLSNEAILGGKWLGSVLSTRPAWWYLGTAWGLSVVTGGMSPFSLPLVVLAWAVYASFAASLGMYCSLVAGTTWRATFLALSLAFMLVAAPWPLGWALEAAGVDLGVSEDTLECIQTFTLMPPMTLGALTFQRWDVPPGRFLGPSGQFVPYALAGVALYAALAALGWGYCRLRFGRITGRMPVR
jgi:ABC-type transport system involved in multi-copper enzyme maturation permease subunit